MSCGGNPPDPPKGPGVSGAPTWLELGDELYFGVASVPGRTSVHTRPWHVGAAGVSRSPPLTLKEASEALRKLQTTKNAKEASKTIKSYGWYSGFCFGATVGYVWNS